MQKLFRACVFVSLSIPLFVLSAPASAQQPSTSESAGTGLSHKSAETGNGTAERHFQFNYGARIADLPPGAHVKVWIPIAETNQQQTVKLNNSSTPGTLKLNRDVEHRNQIGSFEFVADGKTSPKFALNYAVKRRPARPYPDRSSEAPTSASNDRYLKSNRTVPVTGKPIALIKGLALPANSMKKARTLYDVVFEHMDYDKSKPGYGNGDSVWACDSRTGNCTDFHSLFISLSRNQNLAAKFEIGFPIPTDAAAGKIGGYHCWAWFLSPEDGWVPVDISEADKHPELKDRLFGFLPADRVAFSTGRDIVLVPPSQAPPQNFFVYPHVEVDRKTWPKDKIELDFSFKDL